MRRLLVFLCAVSLVLGVAGISGASPITFTDTTYFYADGTNPEGDLDSYGGIYVNKLEGFLDHVTWTHHFDFDPEAAVVLSGAISIELSDDQVNWGRRTFDDLAPEFGVGWGEDFTWDIGEVDTGTYAYSVTASFLADGEYTVTVASLGGDFFINLSDLEITYEPIPEPATILLLGSGLVGLAGFRRKKYKK